MPDDEQVFMFERSLDGHQLLVICNYSDAAAKAEIPEKFAGCDNLLIGNYVNSGALEHTLKLKPYEARVYMK